MTGLKLRWLRCFAGLSLMTAAADGSFAQVASTDGFRLRDPTIAPSAENRNPAPAGEPEWATAKISTIAVNGRPYVMVGSRLRGVGDKLGSAKIERITETEVWLRDGKNLKKINLHPGVNQIASKPSQE